MSNTIVSTFTSAPAQTATHAEEARKILHLGFIVAPFLAGLDKFFGLLTNWEQYLDPSIAAMLPFSALTFLAIVGVIEMFAAVLVAVRPKIGAYVVAAWLAAIILNLLMIGNFYDVALRDLGLLLGALALARLSEE